MFDLYSKIESLCSERGTNITQMCRQAGIPRSALSDYKAGRKKSISFVNMEKMAEFFGVPIEDITGKSKKESPPIVSDEGANEVLAIFEELTPENRAKLLELSRLYIDAQRKPAKNE